MNNFGFIRTAAISPLVKPADIAYNVNEIISEVGKIKTSRPQIVVLPELSVTGYTCADLFRSSLLLDEAERGLDTLAKKLKEIPLVIVGAPVRHLNRLFNCAVFLSGGEVSLVMPKSYLPNNNEFYEKRWFSSGKDIYSETIAINGKEVLFGTRILFSLNGIIIGAEICEDLWVPVPPSCAQALAGADIIVNLSATNEVIGKHDYLLSLIKQQSARCRCGYVYSSAGTGESSTDVVYSGNAIIAEDGSLLAKSPRFTYETKTVLADIDVERLRADRRNSTSFSDNESGNDRFRIIRPANTSSCSDLNFQLPLLRHIDPHPFVPSDSSRLDEHCREIISIQASGLAQRLRATGCENLVVGLSGGLDSTLAILVAHRAYKSLGLDMKGLHAVTMPGFGTTDRTYNNAIKLIERLGVSGKEISIVPSVTQHFLDIGHDIKVQDVTYENGQARERTQILMDYANEVGGMVLGTGDLSELALGWCTYNADQMSMYGVNASVPKTLVKHLVKWVAATTSDNTLKECLEDIIDTPISPELIPAATDGTIKQKTEDLVGPYELHDFFLYHILRFGFSPEKIEMLAQQAFRGVYDDNTIRQWLKTFFRRFFSQQFKRSCMPDGPKVGSICLSPRGDWRMPSDASSALWIDSLETD